MVTSRAQEPGQGCGREGVYPGHHATAGSGEESEALGSATGVRFKLPTTIVSWAPYIELL